MEGWEEIESMSRSAAVASMQAISRVVLMVLMGAALARTGFMPADFRPKLGKLCETCFLPCLLLSRVPAVADLESLAHWWTLPVYSLIYVAAGWLPMFAIWYMGWLPEPMSRFYAGSIAFANATSIPLALLESLIYAFPRLDTRGNTADAISRVSSYIVLYSVFMNILRWSLAKSTLAHGSSAPSGGAPAAATSQELNVVYHGVAQKEDDDHLLAQSAAEKGISQSKPEPLTHTLPAVALAPFKFFLGLSPVLQSSVVALVIGATPALRGLLVGPDAPLRASVQSALVSAGNVYVPAMLLNLGADLSEGPQGKLDKSSILLIAFCKLLVMPVFGLCTIVGMNAFGVFPEDPLYVLMLVIQGATPSAISLTLITRLNGFMNEEMVTLLFYQYLMCIPSMSIFAALGSVVALNL